MLTFVLPLIAASLSSIVEYLRIKYSHGKVKNVSKFVTVNIGVVLFIVCLALSVDYYDEIYPVDVLAYLVYYASCRGILYDITLNTLRGLNIDYVSKTTNSLIDRMFVRKSTFWITKLVYLVIAALSGLYWKILSI